MEADCPLIFADLMTSDLIIPDFSAMNVTEIQKYFLSTMKGNPDLSPALAAIQSLIEFLRLNPAETMVELRKNLRDAIDGLCKADSYITGTSISSGCELFLRFITLAALDHSNFDECKAVLIERGNIFLGKVAGSRDKIAKYFHPFIQDGATILVHSKSRVVLQALKEAATKHRKRFHVYVSEANPDKSGVKMHEALTECGIPSTVILDAAVGYIMETVDLVILGAEGVVESGGIINKIGSFTVAIAAKVHNKPVFVLSESFKFVRVFPLNQRDVPNSFKYTQATLLRHEGDLSKEHPYSDYTPRSYITLLFTDLGILTPSAVSDELIRLYL